MKRRRGLLMAEKLKKRREERVAFRIESADNRANSARDRLQAYKDHNLVRVSIIREMDRGFGRAFMVSARWDMEAMLRGLFYASCRGPVDVSREAHEIGMQVREAIIKEAAKCESLRSPGMF